MLQRRRRREPGRGMGGVYEGEFTCLLSLWATKGEREGGRELMARCSKPWNEPALVPVVLVERPSRREYHGASALAWRRGS